MAERTGSSTKPSRTAPGPLRGPSLRQDAAGWDAERWLCGLAWLGDVTDALEAWPQSPSPHAVEHLAKFAYNHLDRLAVGDVMDGPFWEGTVPGVREGVTAWVLGADVRRWLCTASAPVEADVRWRFDAACALLCVDGGPA